MLNRTTVAKAFATAACALAIALFIIGMGVNSTWAGSDQPVKKVGRVSAITGIRTQESAPASVPAISSPANIRLSEASDRIKKISSTRPRESLKTTCSRYHLVENLIPDGNACTWSDDCYSECCHYISQMQHVCDSPANADTCAPNRTPAPIPTPAPSVSPSSPPSPAPSASPSLPPSPQMTEYEEACLEGGGQIDSNGECVHPDDNENYKRQ
jgi:hypothetical protein